MFLRITALLAMLAIVFVGCANFEALQPGNQLAMENQANLEKNVVRLYDNLKKAGEASGNWTPEDEAIWNEQRDTTLEQLATNNAWLLVIQDAVTEDKLDAGFFQDLLKDLPEWIGKGKDIYELIKKKKEE